MSTRTDARAQLDLPGQAAVAHGPHDLGGMYVMHHAFRRDLGRFASAVRRTPLEDTAAWRSLAARWERFGTTLHHHHTIEDTTIWPLLLAHVDAAVDAAGRATLEAMEAEHELIDPLLDSCATGFTAMAFAPDAAARDRLAERVTAARDRLGEHLAHEETEALPLAQRHLTTAEWAAAERAAQSGHGLREMPFLLPWAAHGLSDEQVSAAFGEGGRAFGVLLRLTRGRFERAERAAFRYA
ncbi:hemerythrin domain-containing protein [Geodermatophilus sp. CPCC 205761]|uniref:hemerythrin domain-containing protein n=1 Tax=Geodermatophilus sp. CPCC 205761 TaxID=2936597 RepID=UPI003EEE25D8